MVVIAVTFVFLREKAYSEEHTILSHLQMINMTLKQYYAEDKVRRFPEAYPKSLKYITDRGFPNQKITNKIIYTYPEKTFYTIKINSTTKNGLWFYYPYKEEAWICLDGIVKANKIPLSNILYKGKPITKQP